MCFTIALADLTMYTGLFGQAPMVGSKNSENSEKYKNIHNNQEDYGISLFGSSYIYWP